MDNEWDGGTHGEGAANMTTRQVTAAELGAELADLLAAVEAGETVVVVETNAEGQRVQRAVLLGAKAYQQLAGEETHEPGPPVEARVGGVAGGLVAGAGTTIASISGKPGVAKGAQRLGRRLGRALAVGLDAMGDDKANKKPKR